MTIEHMRSKRIGSKTKKNQLKGYRYCKLTILSSYEIKNPEENSNVAEPI